MTDDLVKQAKEFAALIMDNVYLSGSSTHDLLVGMSDRIEALEAALREIELKDDPFKMRGIARAALAGEKKDD